MSYTQSPAGFPAVVRPSGDDDAPAILAALASGRDVQLAAGAYNLETQLLLSAYSGRTIRGAGRTQTIITCTVPVGGGGAENAAIYATLANQGALLTLAANPTKGSRTFTVTTTTNLAVGARVLLADQANFSQTFEVLTITGSSNPYTVTVDREIRYSFTTSTSSASKVVCPTEITLADFTLLAAQTNTRGIELTTAIRCRLERLAIRGKFGWGASFDVGGLENVMLEPVVVGDPTVMGVGLALESQIGPRIISPHVEGVGTATGAAAGIYVYAASGGGIEGEGFVDSCTGTGILVDYLSGSQASDGFGIEGCVVTKCANNVTLGDGTRKLALERCRLAYATGYGLLSTGTAASGLVVRGCILERNVNHNVELAAGTGATFTGCAIDRSGATGVDIASAATGTRFEGCDFSTNVTTSITTAASVSLERCGFVDTIDAIIVNGSASIHATDCTYSRAGVAAGIGHALGCASSARSQAIRCTIDGTGGDSIGAITSGAGGWDLDGCAISGCTFGARFINGGGSIITRDCVLTSNGSDTGTTAAAANRTQTTTT